MLPQLAGRIKCVLYDSTRGQESAEGNSWKPVSGFLWTLPHMPFPFTDLPCTLLIQKIVAMSTAVCRVLRPNKSLNLTVVLGTLNKTFMKIITKYSLKDKKEKDLSKWTVISWTPVGRKAPPSFLYSMQFQSTCWQGFLLWKSKGPRITNCEEQVV